MKSKRWAKDKLEATVTSNYCTDTILFYYRQSKDVPVSATKIIHAHQEKASLMWQRFMLNHILKECCPPLE